MPLIICPECGASISDSAPACVQCGFQRIAPQKPRQVKMNFITAVETCLLKKYVGFEGRASRAEYWYFFLFGLLLSFVGNVVISIFASVTNTTIYYIWIYDLLDLFLLLTTFLPSVAVSVRRLHDINRSGWWLLVGLTIIGLFLLFFWHICKGTEGDNEYGKDPLES